MREAAKEATVLLYSPGVDPYLEELIKKADHVFHFDERPRAETRIAAKVNPRAQKSQTTLEAFS